MTYMSAAGIKVVDVIRTEIYTASGQTFVVEGGFLDIGILDSMKDLLVNFIGAVVFCTFGFLYLRNEEKHKISSGVIKGLAITPKDISGGEVPEETGSSEE